MNPAISRLTIAGGRESYFRVGDLVTIPRTNEVLCVSSIRDLGPRYWHDETIALPLVVWRWLRGQGWQRRRRVIDAWWGGWIKVYRHAPTGLERRLP